MNKKVNFLFFALGLCLAFVTYRTFSSPSEEEKVRRVLQAVEGAAEREELLKILSYVAEDYQDDMGFDRPTLVRIGTEIFRTYQQIFVHLKDLSIDVKDDTARARFVAVVLASRPGEEGQEDLLTERGSDRFLVTFRKTDHAWKIVRTEIPPSTFD